MFIVSISTNFISQLALAFSIFLRTHRFILENKLILLKKTINCMIPYGRQPSSQRCSSVVKPLPECRKDCPHRAVPLRCFPFLFQHRICFFFCPFPVQDLLLIKLVIIFPMKKKNWLFN